MRFECVFVRACGYQSFIVWRRGLLGSGEEALYTQVYFFPLSLSLSLVKNCRAGHTAHALFFVLSTAVTIVVSVGLSPFCFSSFLLFWEMARVCKLFRSVTGTRAFVWKERKKRLWRGGLFRDCEFFVIFGVTVRRGEVERVFFLCTSVFPPCPDALFHSGRHQHPSYPTRPPVSSFFRRCDELSFCHANI